MKEKTKEKTIEQHLDLAQKKQSQGKLDEAIDIYRQIIQLFPLNHQPYNHLGKVLIQQGNLEQAMPSATRSVIAIFQQGIELQPNFPWLYLFVREDPQFY